MLILAAKKFHLSFKRLKLMNIAVDIRSLLEERISGVEEYTTQLIRSLLKIAPEHKFQLFYNSYKPVTLPDFGTGNYQIHSWHWPNKLFNTCQLISGQPCWDSLVSADVFFIPNVRLAPVSSNTPLIVTAHDLSFERFPEFYSWQRRLWHRAVRPKYLMKNADRIIAVSQATADDVASLYNVSPSRISVVHSGIVSYPDKITSAEQLRVIQKYNLPNRFVLYLGTLEPRKNVQSIVESFSAIASFIPHDLVIAGSPGWLMHEVEAAIARSKVKSRIRLIGFVAESDKRALYATADLFVYPSFYEGFGFPPLEALTAGTPVITSHNSALSEIVGEWTTLVDPYQPAELALVMRELLHEPPIISEDTKKSIYNKYSWERAARQTLAILLDAV